MSPLTKPIVEVLVGMIASGKSTYAAKRAKDGAIIINDDALVTALHGGDYKLYSTTCKPLYKTTSYGIAQISLAMGRDVVVDATNSSKKTRSKWLALAHSFDVGCAVVVFPKDAPAVHASRRYYAEDRGYSLEQWTKVAERHAAQYEEPTIEEGFDAYLHLSPEQLLGWMFPS